MTEQKIVPCIWFDEDADDAVAFYLTVFPGSAERSRTNYPNEGLADFQQDMAGRTLTIDFTIGGFRITALNAGDEFEPNPMLSFLLNYDPSVDAAAADRLEATWQRLADGGKVLMEIGEYPFSPRYGWIQDKFGVSWQLMLTNPEGEPRPFVIPSLMFANANVNRANEALEFYASTFDDTATGTVAPYDGDQGLVHAGSVMFGEFSVGDQWFAVMDSPVAHEFDFTEGVSLQVECIDQAEIDDFWEQLSSVPEAEACGWCKDRFGVSWQVVPANMEQLITPANFAAMMTMKKIVIDDFPDAAPLS